METVSENKRRRGRPRIYEDILRDLAVCGVNTDDFSRRGKQNKVYRQFALQELIFNKDVGDQFKWLCDRQACLAGTAKMRSTILAELGRIEDGDDMRNVARQICEMKPTSKVAIALIRNWRLGQKPADGEQLGMEIIKAIDAYRNRHRDASFGLIYDALDFVNSVYHAEEEDQVA